MSALVQHNEGIEVDAPETEKQPGDGVYGETHAYLCSGIRAHVVC